MAHGSAVTTQYLAEVFAPRCTLERLQSDSRGIGAAAEALTDSGEPVRYLHSLLIPGEETAFHFFEAADADAVVHALHGAGLEAERISPTVVASGDGGNASHREGKERAWIAESRENRSRGDPAVCRAKGGVMSKRNVLAAVFGVLALALLVVLTGTASAHGTAATPTTFTDPAGDANGAPDITSVAVSDDLASGMIQVTVTQTGLFNIGPQAAGLVEVYMDTDLNASTGDHGNDYVVGYYIDPTGRGWDMGHFDGGAWQSMPQSATMSMTRTTDGSVLNWHFSRADIGGQSSGFTLWAWSAVIDPSVNLLARDDAPDSGSWTYMLSVKPVIGTPLTTPARAAAGKRFTVSFPVTRSDNNAPLTTGTMMCDPSVKGKVIRHAESFKNGVARLSFLIPKTAKGKLLKVKVTITAGDQATTRITTFRVK